MGGRPELEHHQRWQHGQPAADEQRDPAADEALHDHLARVGAHAGRGQPRGEQRDREHQRGTAADHSGRARRARPRSCMRGIRPPRLASETATNSIERLIRPAAPSAIEHVEPLEAQQLPPLGVVAAGHPGLRQGRVQVDDVRHHGRPDDARDEQQHAAVAGEARDQPGRDAPRAAPPRPPGRRRSRGRRCRAGRRSRARSGGSRAAPGPGSRTRRPPSSARPAAAARGTAGSSRSQPRRTRPGRWPWRSAPPAPTGHGTRARGRCSRHSSGRSRPVATPTLADRYCTSMAIRLAATMTHASA